MAITVLTNVSVTYNSVDISSFVESCEINQAYERMLKSDVKYRFVIDMASLQKSA